MAERGLSVGPHYHLALGTAVRTGGTPAAAGQFSWGGNPGVGSLHRMRDAVEREWPGPLEIVEHSHSAMAHAYEAGASGMPCAFFRGHRGSDLASINSQVKFITCPFTGEDLACIPAHRLDVTIIHAQKADRELWVRH